MAAYDNNDTTYNYDDYPVQFTVQLFLVPLESDIQEDERDYITPIFDYSYGNYNLVVKTDGSEEGTNACFSHNDKTEEIKVFATPPCRRFCPFSSPEDQEVHYKAIISPAELWTAALASLYEGADQVITANRARGLQVWVYFTERGWKLECYSTHTSTQEEIDRRIEEEEEEIEQREQEEQERLQVIAEALEPTFQ